MGEPRKRQGISHRKQRRARKREKSIPRAGKISLAPSLTGHSALVHAIHRMAQAASLPRPVGNMIDEAITYASEVYGRTRIHLDKVANHHLPHGERYRSLGKLKSATKALRPPGPVTLSDGQLRREVGQIFALWKPWQALVAECKRSDESPAGVLSKAYQGDDEAREIIRQVPRARGLLKRLRLDLETRKHLGRVQRWKWRTFVACVLAGEHGGKPARWIDRLRDISLPKTRSR